MVSLIITYVNDKIKEVLSKKDERKHCQICSCKNCGSGRAKKVVTADASIKSWQHVLAIGLGLLLILL